MTESRPTIVVIDDDDTFVDLVSEILEPLHCFVEAYAAETPVGEVAHAWPDLVLVDARLTPSDPMSGWSLARALQADHRLAGVPVVLCTGDHEFAREHVVEAATMHEFTVLTKPFRVEELRAVVRGAPGSRIDGRQAGSAFSRMPDSASRASGPNAIAQPGYDCSL